MCILQQKCQSSVTLLSLRRDVKNFPLFLEDIIILKVLVTPSWFWVRTIPFESSLSVLYPGLRAWAKYWLGAFSLYLNVQPLKGINKRYKWYLGVVSSFLHRPLWTILTAPRLWGDGLNICPVLIQVNRYVLFVCKQEEFDNTGCAFLSGRRAFWKRNGGALDPMFGWIQKFQRTVFP